MSDRTALLNLLPKGSVGVEVGVWMGDLSEEIIQVVEPSRLYLVDPWEKNEDLTNYSSTVTRSQDELDDICQGVFDRLGQGPVVMYRARSVDVARDFTDPVDWVYVDGIHTFDAVTADLEAWWPHIKAGGLMSGHDVGIEGVRHAVVQFAVKHDVTCTVLEGNFMIRKPHKWQVTGIGVAPPLGIITNEPMESND